MATPNLSVNLPWQNLAAGGNALAGVGGDPAAAMAQLGGLYNQNYQASLGLNAGLSQGIQGGFEGLRKSVDQQYAGILSDYQKNYGNVFDKIAGTNQTNLNDINAAYNAQSGASSQDLINRGLGNSTVQMSMQRGIEQDRQRALLASQNQFSQLQAGYMGQYAQGAAGIGQQGAGLGANLGLAQLGSLERTNIPYPDAGMYMNLAHMYGANLQRQQDQKAAQDAMQMQAGGFGFTRSGVGGVSGGSHGFAPLSPSGIFDTKPYGPAGVTDAYSGISSWNGPTTGLGLAQQNGFQAGGPSSGAWGGYGEITDPFAAVGGAAGLYGQPAGTFSGYDSSGLSDWGGGWSGSGAVNEYSGGGDY